MSVGTDLRVPKAPPAWFNAAVRRALRTPGLRHALGGSIAELTVTGAKTGRPYAIPVQPLSWNSRWVVLSLRSRSWWRNIRASPEVELLRQGRSIQGHAEVLDDAERARTVLADCLHENAAAAKTYGLDTGDCRTIDDATLADLVEMLVVIVIEVAPIPNEDQDDVPVTCPDDRHPSRWGTHRANRLAVVAGWLAIGAGCGGLAGLLSTLPWPELFSIDATPRNAVFRDPGLLSVLVGHYAILALGGLSGLLAGLFLGVEFRRRLPTAAAALLVAAGSGTMGYAAMRKAIDLTIHDGRSTLELESLVWAGGGLVLVGTALLSIALRHAGRLLVVLGLASPVLVSGGIAVFTILGPDVYPTIWGLTFPPPTDYLLATWFIVLGWLAKTGQLRFRSQHAVHHPGTRSDLAVTS